MSIKVMTEVWESSSTKGGARLVLLALADYANDEGYCHPGVERLALKSALTERNVQFILRELEARGELVTLQRAGRGHVNAYWVVPPKTVARLRLEGKTAKSFHPFQMLEEKVKSGAEKVKSAAQMVKSETEKVKPTSPRTVKNHQESPMNNTSSEGTSEIEIPQDSTGENQSSSVQKTQQGTTNGHSQSSAPRAANRAWTVWLEANQIPDWLELEVWNRWLHDLDERTSRITSGRLEEQLKRLQELYLLGEPQTAIVARAIAGGWENFYPPRAKTNPPSTPKPISSRERYGRYR
jgi:Helix-turn-helix domain